MKRILQEPLLHFVLLGAALFVAYGMMSRTSNQSEPAAIVVTQGQIEHLAISFTQAWRRPPTAEELAGLVRDLVREEVYCREAVAMGLDQDDTVIRRRLRQKLEFVSADIAAMAEPSEADLQAYLEANPEAFRTPTRFSFTQIHLDPAKHGVHLARDAADLLARLNQAGAPVDLADLGDSRLLDQQFALVSATDIAQQFGAQFASQLGLVEPGRWVGPLESGYGVHLVLVTARTEGRLPPLADVRPAVRTAWTNARRLAANEEFYQNLLKRYKVVIEPPPRAPAASKAVVSR